MYNTHTLYTYTPIDAGQTEADPVGFAVPDYRTIIYGGISITLEFHGT